MKKVVKIPDKVIKKRQTKLPGIGGSVKPQTNAFTSRLFIVVDLMVFGLIEWLKDVLEAPSFGDVIRQAVRAYALDLAKAGHVNDVCELPVDGDPSGKLKKMNIRIPFRTTQRLEMLKEKTGLTYTDIIICGLGILALTAKEQERILTDFEKGDTNANENISLGSQFKSKAKHCRSVSSDHSRSEVGSSISA